MEEVNKFIESLKIAFDKEKLGKESNQINAHITEEEFRHYFQHKDECTESSPSGRHVGHYKAILYNKDLVSLVVAMLNIGLCSGIALERWKKALSIMLEKDKGSPKIERLRIIQLFEADFNFLLALIFGHRLMRFANIAT